jgi:predicted  nucleic acid-binding Zn-ribbon protein
MDGPHALLALQELDTEGDQLRHRRAHLPQRVRLDEVTAVLATVESDGATVTAQRDELARRQAEIEAELATLEKRATELDSRMRSGAITASRDLQAMADQLQSLQRRRSDLEDSDLEIMERLDPLEARLTELQERWAVLEREATELRGQVAEAEVEVDGELERVGAARAEAAARVPAELMPAYERLRHRLGGIAAAPLVGSSCGGCHLTLAAGELDTIRRLPPEALVTCEQCGRILVR